MAINNGVIQATIDDVEVRFFYDPDTQALTDTPVPGRPFPDGPRGFALDLVNPTGKVVRITVGLPDGSTQTVQIGRGDPVTTGPASGRSRTAAQLAQLGLTTREQVSSLSFG